MANGQASCRAESRTLATVRREAGRLAPANRPASLLHALGSASGGLGAAASCKLPRRRHRRRRSAPALLCSAAGPLQLLIACPAVPLPQAAPSPRSMWRSTRWTWGAPTAARAAAPAAARWRSPSTQASGSSAAARAALQLDFTREHLSSHSCSTAGAVLQPPE